MSTFETWIFDGVRFLGVATPDGVHVTDQYGNWYGGFQSVKSCRAMQQDGRAEPLAGLKATPAVRIHSRQQEKP